MEDSALDIFDSFKKIDRIGEKIKKELKYIECTGGNSNSGFLLPYSVMWYKEWPLRKPNEVREVKARNRVASLFASGSINDFSVRGSAIIVGGKPLLRKDLLCEFRPVIMDMYKMFSVIYKKWKSGLAK